MNPAKKKNTRLLNNDLKRGSFGLAAGLGLARHRQSGVRRRAQRFRGFVAGLESSLDPGQDEPERRRGVRDEAVLAIRQRVAQCQRLHFTVMVRPFGTKSLLILAILA